MTIVTEKNEKVVIDGYAPYRDKIKSGDGKFKVHAGGVMVDFSSLTSGYAGKFSIEDAVKIRDAFASAIKVAKTEVTDE